MRTGDSIFALSSGAPPAAIAIIRISGPAAFDVVKALTDGLPEPRVASLRRIKHPASGEMLDQAVVLVFLGPKSATGEDLAELHLHGGRAVVRAVEDAIAARPGLRRAEPGEFTRRALLNGRIDLNEAEGLGDLLAAETEWQRKAASAMFGGAFSAAIEKWRQDVLHLSALTEAELDFSDEGDVGPQLNSGISQACKKVQAEIEQALSAPSAEKLRDGLRVVLAGPPNSGKSMLLNVLVARDAAIVSDIAGTTRDLIEIPVAFDGVPFLFVDTAGLREYSHDPIEMMGIERSQAALGVADIVLWLGTEGHGPDDSELIEVAARRDHADFEPKGDGAIAVSAKTGEGIEELVAAVMARASGLLPHPGNYAVNQRQRKLLAACADDMMNAGDAQDPLVVAEHLRLARLSLDSLTGRAHTEEMLDALFGRFCIGK